MNSTCVISASKARLSSRLAVNLKASQPHLYMAKPFSQRPSSAKHQRGHPIASQVREDGSFDADALDVDNLQLDDPFGKVEDMMTTGNLRYATPDQPLAAAASKLDKVTGLAVVDDNMVVVGVISIKDINRLKKQGNTLEDPVKMHMSTPPIVVRPHARIGEAAAIMLAKKIHRLPVVDSDNKLLGIVSRTDIFRPLLNAKEDMYEALSVIKGGQDLKDAFQRSMDEDMAAALIPEDDWSVKYLYDGDCSMCLQMVSLLKGKEEQMGKTVIKYVNIASMTYNPDEHEHITYEDAMETIHAIKKDGTIVRGAEAMKLLYGTVGWGGFAMISSWPIISQMVELFYQIANKLRLPVGKSMDSILAMRRMKMTEEGIEHCIDDEEECEASW